MLACMPLPLGTNIPNKKKCVFRSNVDKTLDPRFKPEDNNLNSLFLCVIPAGLNQK